MSFVSLSKWCALYSFVSVYAIHHAWAIDGYCVIWFAVKLNCLFSSILPPPLKKKKKNIHLIFCMCGTTEVKRGRRQKKKKRGDNSLFLVPFRTSMLWDPSSWFSLWVWCNWLYCCGFLSLHWQTSSICMTPDFLFFFFPSLSLSPKSMFLYFFFSHSSVHVCWDICFDYLCEMSWFCSSASSLLMLFDKALWSTPCKLLGTGPL